MYILKVGNREVIGLKDEIEKLLKYLLTTQTETIELEHINGWWTRFVIKNNLIEAYDEYGLIQTFDKSEVENIKLE